MIISCHFKKPSYPFTFCWKFRFAKFSLSSMKLKIWKFRLYSYGFTLFLSMLWSEIIISGSYFVLLEFCSWIIDKGLYFRRWFRYCSFGIWMKIITYWLSFEFFYLLILEYLIKPNLWICKFKCYLRRIESSLYRLRNFF